MPGEQNINLVAEARLGTVSLGIFTLDEEGLVLRCPNNVPVSASPPIAKLQAR